jgi:hypothetical protein
MFRWLRERQCSGCAELGGTSIPDVLQPSPHSHPANLNRNKCTRIRVTAARHNSGPVAPAIILLPPRDRPVVATDHFQRQHAEPNGDVRTAVQLFAGPQSVEFDHAVRGIAADHAGGSDAIEVAATGTRAVGRFHCSLEVATEIPQDCTPAQMAHAQGGGLVLWTERRVLHVRICENLRTVGDREGRVRLSLSPCPASYRSRLPHSRRTICRKPPFRRISPCDTDHRPSRLRVGTL